MMFKKLDFMPGNIVYDDFDIDPKVPFEEQIFSLKEDMFQINYADKYLIDVGWAPEFDLNGKFKVRIIKDFDWMHPLYFKKTKNLKMLFKHIKECIKIVKKKILYDRFIDRPTTVKAIDFERNVKVVFCPICCPDLKKAQPINLIDKATITKKNRQIYICKPCKLVWLTEDIRADNAQDYKKFMKSIGLKGFWNELNNVDVL